ncbi:MAG: hypothetical protein ACYSWO_01375 [Planctomycetota bacterium]
MITAKNHPGKINAGAGYLAPGNNRYILKAMCFTGWRIASFRERNLSSLIPLKVTIPGYRKGSIMDLIASQVLDSSEGIILFAQTSVGGAAIGLALGLLTYFIGWKRGDRKLGTVAVPACVVSGLALGAVLALPVAIAFSVAIITGGDAAMNRILNESARGNTDLLRQIIQGESDQADGDVTENPAPEEQAAPEELTVSAADESAEPRRPLVENLFS